MKSRFLFFIFLGIVAFRLDASDARITASLEPAEIALGQSAQLNLMVEGVSSSSPPNIPNVPGLEFRFIGQSTQIQFINGTMTGGITYLFQVMPVQAGDFTLPEITVQAGAEVLKTLPLPLKVTGPSDARSNAGAHVVAPSTPAGQAPQNTSDPDFGDQIGGIQLILPKRDFYVGELIPTDLKVYLNRGLEIARVSLPMLSGNAFTISKLGDKPERSNEIIDGKPWHVLTWHTAVAAVKAGEHDLGAKMGCTLLVAANGRRPMSPFDDAFDDPFFDRFFQHKEERDVAMRSKELRVRVLPLPSEGRPVDFSGAIGQFQLNPLFVSSKEAASGDPVTLKTTILGTGNFDRVEAPQLSNKQNLKTYPPSGKFEPTDEAGYAGQKGFDQIVIPLSPEVKEIPPLNFSYFDPEHKQYVTLNTQAVPLHVLPGQQNRALPVIPSPVADHGAPRRSKHAEPTDLVSNKLEMERSVSHRILAREPWFWAAGSLPLLLTLGVAGMSWQRRRMENNPDLAAAFLSKRAVQLQWEKMEKARREQKAIEFFEAAKHVVQEKLGRRTGTHSESFTLDEVDERSWSADLKNQIRELFRTADAVLYSGQVVDAKDLEAWVPVVKNILRGVDDEG